MGRRAAPNRTWPGTVKIGAYSTRGYSVAGSPMSIGNEPSGSWTNTSNCVVQRSKGHPRESRKQNSDRGVLHSGIFCGRIADVHRERAKRIVDKYIELRRATLERAPEVISEDDFRELLEAAYATIDGALRAIPEHLKRYGLQIPAETARQNDGLEGPEATGTAP